MNFDQSSSTGMVSNAQKSADLKAFPRISTTALALRTPYIVHGAHLLPSTTSTTIISTSTSTSTTAGSWPSSHAASWPVSVSYVEGRLLRSGIGIELCNPSDRDSICEECMDQQTENKVVT